MLVADCLFYLLAGLSLAAALGVVLFANPIYCALSLVLTMMGVAGIFLHLGAVFLAGVQVIVYAGAVVVLFVMIVMLFDLKQEVESFSRGILGGAAKLISAGLLAGFVIFAAEMSLDTAELSYGKELSLGGTKELAALLFSKYLFVFEIISILILLVIVGVIALAKGEGGTHAGS